VQTSDSNTGQLNGRAIPSNWLPVFVALFDQLSQSSREKATCEVELRVVLHEGGIRDRYKTVRSKIA
jgi:hypothetical protein